MTTAPYFDRAKIAAAQVIAGFDADAFTAALEKTSVAISLGDDVASSPQGRACADLAVRLCARLYPTFDIITPENTGRDDQRQQLASDLRTLATAINPSITLDMPAATVVHVGTGTPPAAPSIIYVGSDDWVGRLSLEHPCPVGRGPVPIGAGVAACLAAGALFRLLLDPTAPRPGDAELAALPEPLPVATSFALPERTALVGAGAVGQAFLWALSRSPVTGALVVVEPEHVDLGNLQRYVLTDMGSVGRSKTEVAGEHVESAVQAGGIHGLEVKDHPGEWATAMTRLGPRWDAVAVAVDSAEARRGVQASLPQWLVNAWTQTGDLGVSTHDFLQGACCACLYLPVGTGRNEDELVAEALGVPNRLMEVRTLLYDGGPTPDALLEAVAEGLAIDPSALAPFQGVPLRDLYVKGICGGGVLPLSHHPGQSPVHVPLAHQSALAGVLLAARLLQLSGGSARAGTDVTRVDVRRDPPEQPHQRAAKDPRGICCCQDRDYIAAYQTLWPHRPA